MRPTREQLLEAALGYASQGTYVIPLCIGGKTPVTPNGFHDATTDPNQIRSWWTLYPYSIGVPTGRLNGFDVVDVDVLGSESGFPALRKLINDGLLQDPHKIVQTPRGGWHIYFRHLPQNRNSVDGKAHIDFRGEGGYVVAPPSWSDEFAAGWTVLDDVPGNQGTVDLAAIKAALREAPDSSPRRRTATGGRRRRSVAAATEEFKATTRHGQHNVDLFQAACDAARGGAADLANLEELIAAAEEVGHSPSRTERTCLSALRTVAEDDSQDDDSDRLEDAYVAARIADELAAEYAWTSGLGWLRYSDGRWASTCDEVVIEAVRSWMVDYFETLMATLDPEDEDDQELIKAARSLLAARKINAVSRLCRGLLRHDAIEFDADPFLLNVGNGVVDLCTGELRAHDPARLLTKIASVAFKADAVHPDWDAALACLPDDVVPWMQTRFGQAITGDLTPDDLLPVLYGSGSNGKSTLLAAIRSALGEYAITASGRLLMCNPSDHSTELADLRGARLAIAEETPETGRLDVKRLKDVVGTPRLRARKLYRDNTEWSATHSLFIASNYRPIVEETDHGTWRRLALVTFPFTYITPDEPIVHPSQRHENPGLRLRLERGTGQREAVLAWLVAGARAYYDAGQRLPAPPPAVLEATQDWRAESDLILAFVVDRLALTPDYMVSATDLYKAFVQWLSDRGHRPWSQQTFNSRFGDHDAIHGTVTRARPTRFQHKLSLPSGEETDAVYGRPHIWTGIRFQPPTVSRYRLSDRPDRAPGTSPSAPWPSS